MSSKVNIKWPRSPYPPEGALWPNLRPPALHMLRFPVLQRRHVRNAYNHPMCLNHYLLQTNIMLLACVLAIVLTCHQHTITVATLQGSHLFHKIKFHTYCKWFVIVFILAKTRFAFVKLTNTQQTCHNMKCLRSPMPMKSHCA